MTVGIWALILIVQVGGAPGATGVTSIRIAEYGTQKNCVDAANAAVTAVGGITGGQSWYLCIPAK